MTPTTVSWLLFLQSAATAFSAGPPAGAALCTSAPEDIGACDEPPETFLLQVVLSVHPGAAAADEAGPGNRSLAEGSGLPGPPAVAVGNSSVLQRGNGTKESLVSVSSEFVPPQVLPVRVAPFFSLSEHGPTAGWSWAIEAQEHPEGLPIRAHRSIAGIPVAPRTVGFSPLRTSTHRSMADYEPDSRANVTAKPLISKRVFIVLEMVPAAALLGLDRIYLCDGCPFDTSGSACKRGEGSVCYLGFVKMALGIFAFVRNTKLIPVTLIWWFIDAGFVIDNCVRGERYINIFGLSAQFDEETVEEARRLSLAAAGQFGLELALFLPAVFALVAGTQPEGVIHRRIHSAMERLRPPRGASEEAIESSTSTLLYKAGQGEKEGEEVCSICCDAFQEDDKLRELPCKHQFHAACVDEWLARNRTCPLCKADITRHPRQGSQDEDAGPHDPEVAEEERQRTNLAWSRALNPRGWA